MEASFPFHLEPGESRELAGDAKPSGWRLFRVGLDLATLAELGRDLRERDALLRDVLLEQVTVGPLVMLSNAVLLGYVIDWTRESMRLVRQVEREGSGGGLIPIPADVAPTVRMRNVGARSHRFTLILSSCEVVL